MKPQKLLRQIHHWASPVILLPLGLVIATGLLLLVKKDFDWIQPPSVKGESPTAVPSQSFEAIFAAAQGVKELELENWSDLARVDVKPNKGTIKLIAANHWEAQIDTQTGQVLQVAYRRSDLIESLHDGSFFSGWTKRYVFLPSGVLLLIMWVTGLYLFILPHWKAIQKRRRTRGR